MNEARQFIYLLAKKVECFFKTFLHYHHQVGIEMSSADLLCGIWEEL
jgi:hypothetical protein